MYITDWTNISMKAAEDVAEVHITGYIGVPEWWQEDPEFADKITTTKERMRSELKKISNLGAKIINVYIDSYGGDVNHAMSMRNALVAAKGTVNVEYVGWSASAATIIATAAPAERVKAASNMMILVHEARGLAYGTKDAVGSVAETLGKINEMAVQMYSEQSGMSEGDVRDLMGRNGGEGEWITAHEAQEMGFIGEVYEPAKAAASFVPEQIEKARLSGFAIPKNKIQFLTKTEKMNIFGKKEDKSPLNSVQLGDHMAVFEGEELAEGVEVQAIGGADINGEHTLEDGRVVCIEDNVVKKLKVSEPEDVEALSREDIAGMIEEAVKPMAETLASISETVKGLSSNHKPPVKQGISNEVESDDITKATLSIHDKQAKKAVELKTGRK